MEALLGNGILKSLAGLESGDLGSGDLDGLLGLGVPLFLVGFSFYSGGLMVEL